MDRIGDAAQGLINLLDMIGGLVQKALRRRQIRLNDEFRTRDNTWLGAATLLVLVLVVLLLLSCGQEPGKDSQYQVSDLKAGRSTIGPGHEQDRCDPVGMPGYEISSPLARRIADGEPWDFSDELASLALIDSFRTSRHRPFYSAILLRTMTQADGYYSEPLGIALHAELLEHPCSLLGCCWENGCDGRDGLQLWTKPIAMEFMIAHEEDPRAAFVKYGKQVEDRAKAECDLQTSSRVHEFLHEIRSHLEHALNGDSIAVPR